MHIVANKAWAEKNRRRRELFAIARLPLADVSNARNAMMHAGKSSEADVRGHGRLDNAHQQQFDGWVKKRWPRRNKIVFMPDRRGFMRRYPATISPQSARFIVTVPLYSSTSAMIVFRGNVI